MNDFYQIVELRAHFRWTLAFIVAFTTVVYKEARATYGIEVVSAGSYIIDMGATQTVATGVKPYGLVYELIVNNNVPVKWVIDSSKVKDGADFTYASTDYKGGPFIIPAEFIDSTVGAL